MKSNRTGKRTLILTGALLAAVATPALAQVPAHQQALTLHSGYARSGDVPTLRQTAQGAVPIVQGHLTQAQQMLRSVR